MRPDASHRSINIDRSYSRWAQNLGNFAAHTGWLAARSYLLAARNPLLKGDRTRHTDIPSTHASEFRWRVAARPKVGTLVPAFAVRRVVAVVAVAGIDLIVVDITVVAVGSLDCDCRLTVYSLAAADTLDAGLVDAGLVVVHKPVAVRMPVAVHKLAAECKLAAAGKIAVGCKFYCIKKRGIKGLIRQ